MNYYKRINQSDYNGIKSMEKYYAKLKKRKGVIVSNDKQGEFILVPSEMLGEFIVTSVSRVAFRIIGCNGDNVTKKAMRELANALEEEVTSENGMYWSVIEKKAKELGLLKDED